MAKLDTSNSTQMELMHRHFSHNMAAVDFWLDFCVIPDETKQYPYRMVASAWQLADNPNGTVVGFSGAGQMGREAAWLAGWMAGWMDGCAHPAFPAPPSCFANC